MSDFFDDDIFPGDPFDGEPPQQNTPEPPQSLPSPPPPQDQPPDDFRPVIAPESVPGAVLDLFEVDASGWPFGRFIVRDLSPLRLAEHFLNEKFVMGGVLNLHRWNQEFYAWENGGYIRMDDERLQSMIWNHLDRLRKPSLDDDTRRPTGQVEKIKVNSTTVKEVYAALIGCDILIDGTPPFWIDGEIDPDPKNLISFENGYIDSTSENPSVISASPLLFTLNHLKFTFNPWAARPEKWLAFLDKLWPDDAQSIEVLGEWFGYCLSYQTSLQKMLLLIGPKRGGKGTIARVLAELVGSGNVCAPTLGSLAMNFGLWPLIGKSLAIIGDARLSGRVDSSIIIERLLSISGEDAQTIDRKNKSPITMKLGTRFMLISNELPRFPDASGAIASRFVVLNLTRSWFGQEQQNLYEELVEELPGITLWALEGLRRLRSRGRFVTPDASAYAVSDLEELSSPISAWIEECCVFGEGRRIIIKELFSSWAAWCEQNSRRDTGSIQSFARDLRAKMPEIQSPPRPLINGKRERVYEGVDLTLEAAESARLWRSKNGREPENTLY